MEASLNTLIHIFTHTATNINLNLEHCFCPVELLSPGAESDVVMVEGCLDDHDVDRGGGLLDDMDEALTSEGGLLLEAGPSDLCDLHDPDLDESPRAIR